MAQPEPETADLTAALEPYRERFRTRREGGGVDEDPDIDQRAITALLIDYVKAHPETSMQAVAEAVRFRRA